MEFCRDPYRLLIFCRSIPQIALARQNFAVIPMLPNGTTFLRQHFEIICSRIIESPIGNTASFNIDTHVLRQFPNQQGRKIVLLQLHRSPHSWEFDRHSQSLTLYRILEKQNHLKIMGGCGKT
jgi:hypothetical protein